MLYCITVYTLQVEAVCIAMNHLSVLHYIVLHLVDAKSHIGNWIRLEDILYFYHFISFTHIQCIYRKSGNFQVAKISLFLEDRGVNHIKYLISVYKLLQIVK